ncbi:AbrB/MazE/SpoVT family DNA-binding domain-containing protein [Candidatus Woesearchaeota archaeon]|nr:AbrB/MazE/SpoVT family DNA-binding domain-containing protein [Candidatus Woesearchaeota archaeon]
MQRKVIQQGPSTMMVSLPSKWVKENNIKKGDELTVDLNNNQLTIFPHNTGVEKKTMLFFKAKEEYLDRILMSKYREGYDEIVVKYDDPATIEKIRETLKYLLGLEIIDQTGHSCIIKNISQGSHEDYPAMLRRLFQIMLTIADSCLEYTKTKEEKYRHTAIDLRETLVKLQQFCLRLINQQNSYSVQQKSQEFFYVWNIAEFGKIWSSLAKKQLSKKIELSKEDRLFFTAVIQYQREFYETFYKRDAEKLRDMKDKLYSTLRPMGEKQLEKSKYKMIQFYLLRLVNRMYEVMLSF